MNKKAASLPMEQLIGIIVLIVILVIVAAAFFRPEKGWLNVIADKSESFARFIPGRDQVEHPPGLEVPSDIKSAYDSLYNAMDELSISHKTQCWGNYTLIPELNNVKIFLTNTPDGLTIYIVNEKGQKLDSDIFPGLVPCIIAGKTQGTDVASAFRQYYIFPGIHNPSLLSIMYKEVSSIEIQEPLWGTSADIKADGTAYNLDYALLYKHDATHICLMPNYQWDAVCTAGEKGLEDYCFRSNMIKNKVNNRC